MAFPFVDVHEKLDRDPPTSDNIVIIYYPLTGGNFLCNILSCHEKFYGKEFANFLEAKYKKSYDPIKSPAGWKNYEQLFHPTFYNVHPRWFDLDFFLTLDKIIHINYSLDPIETNFLEFRRKFMKKSSINRSDFAEFQYIYELEVFKHLKRNERSWHSMPFKNLLNYKSFIFELDKICEYLNLDYIDPSIVKKVYTAWMQEIMKQAAKNKELNS